MLAGHFGQLLAAHEQPKGQYCVTMATLDCIHTALSLESTVRDSSELLSCVMYVVEEILPVYHKWRYGQNTDMDKICECPYYTYQCEVQRIFHMMSVALHLIQICDTGYTLLLTFHGL